MTQRYLTDPEHPDESRALEAALAERLPAIEPALGRTDELRRRLVDRVRACAQAEASLARTPMAAGEWRTLVRGVRVKTLSLAHRAVLLDLEPGAALPIHRHHEHEECVVLRGEVNMLDIRVTAGDYHRASPGSRHGQVRSAPGALLYLRGTPIDDTRQALFDLATALLPGGGAPPVTLRGGEGEWARLAPGVTARVLFQTDGTQSCMLRFAPGTSLRTALQPMDQEALVVQGELFVGRQPATPGDYVVAPARHAMPEIGTEEGAVVFVRGAPIL